MNDYPTDEEVEKVRKWEFKTPGSFAAFMAHVQSIGYYWPTSFAWVQDGRVYQVSTGGWSGNEEIISAMHDNWTFWTVCWQAHRRGGHYIFELPDETAYFRKATP